MKDRKTIKIKLNDMKYRYDVYLMVNLYYSFAELIFTEDNDEDISIAISEENIKISGIYGSYEYQPVKEYKFSEEVKKAVFIYMREGTGKIMPWGTLVGIRPSKKALSYIEEGMTDEEIAQEFNKRHETLKEKVQLCIDVAQYEKNVVNKDKNTVSIYVGMPFCPTRCLYCSFTSNPVASGRTIVDDYLKCLTMEIEALQRYVDENHLKIETVYFGGGTPTSVNDEQFEDIIHKIYKGFVENRETVEFTVECGRVDSITKNKLSSMKRYHVDRISINPQTMNDKTLKAIGRNHDSKSVEECFNMARDLGFDNINMDLIVGLPGEHLEDVKYSCSKIAELNPDNLTIHGLSVKRGSRLHENLLNNEKYEIPDQDELNLMYAETRKLSESMGMKPYYMYRQKNMVGNMENVGYCRDEKICIYNIEMIEEKQTIIALGADAVSKVVFLDENRIERFANVKDVKEYNNRIQEMISRKIELLDTLYK